MQLTAARAVLLAMSEDFVNITTTEVAAIARVDTSTVRKWAKSGKLPSKKTEGGHFRFDRSYVIERYAPAGTRS